MLSRTPAAPRVMIRESLRNCRNFSGRTSTSIPEESTTVEDSGSSRSSSARGSSATTSRASTSTSTTAGLRLVRGFDAGFSGASVTSDVARSWRSFRFRALAGNHGGRSSKCRTVHDSTNRSLRQRIADLVTVTHQCPCRVVEQKTVLEVGPSSSAARTGSCRGRSRTHGRCRWHPLTGPEEGSDVAALQRTPSTDPSRETRIGVPSRYDGQRRLCDDVRGMP